MTIRNMARMILKPSREGDIPIKGIIFDMDGTLCLPQTWMFKKMREALGISKGTDILDHVHSLPSVEQAEAHRKLEDIERKAMVEMQAQPGLSTLMDFLGELGLPKTICTRNFPIPVNHLLTNFLDGHEFGPLITREFKPPKPSPDGILHIAQNWGIDPKYLIMVGDSVDDMLAGHRAGAATVLLQSDVNGHLNDTTETDVVIHRLDELVDMINNGFTIERPL